MIEVILVIYFNSNPALRPCTVEETTSACKNAEKYVILTLIFDKFSEVPYWGGGTAPLPKPHS